MKKIIIFLLTTFLLYTTTLAKSSDEIDPYDVIAPYDVVSFPYSESVRHIFTVNDMRKLSIKQFEEIIKADCDQVWSEFVQLSIDNWNKAKIGKKSEDEADKYSDMLMKAAHYTEMKLHLYPFYGFWYAALDNTIREKYFGDEDPLGDEDPRKMSEPKFFQIIKNICGNHMAPDKFFNYLDKSPGSDEIKKNIDFNELEEKKIQSKIKSALISLNRSEPQGSKSTPEGIGKKLEFSDSDLVVSRTLMAEDIKNTMKELNQPWYVYQYVLDRKFYDYQSFLITGGNNRQFAALALRTKILNQKSNNYKNIDLNDFNEINSLKDAPFTGDRNQIIMWTKLLGYKKLYQLN